MTTMNDERVAFEAWLGIKPCGAAHDLAYEAFKAGAAWQRAQGAGVPDGWKLVPVIATLEMIDAAVQAIETKQAIWPAMLAAAQSAPAGEREAEAAAIAEEIDWLIRQWDAKVSWSGERMAELLEAAGKAAEMLDRLSREGFGVFQIAASTGQEVGK